jgi:hypothetical protein
MSLRSRPLHRAAPFACVVALSMVQACGGNPAEHDVADAAADANQADPAATSLGAVRSHQALRAAVGADAKLRARFEATVDGLAREGDELRTRAGKDVARRALPRLFAKSAPFADAQATLGVGGHASWTTAWTLQGAAHVPATLIDGRATFSDAFPSTDLIVAASSHAREDWFVLRDPAAPTTFRYHVKLGKSVVKGALEPAGTFALLDAEGSAVLRTERPIAIDATGRRIEGALGWDASTSTLSVGFDARGASYPIVLDPFTGVAAWTLQKTYTANTFIAGLSTKNCTKGIGDYGVGCGNIIGPSFVYRQDLGAIEAVGGMAGGTGGGYRENLERWTPVTKSWEAMSQWNYQFFDAFGSIMTVPGYAYTTMVFGQGTALFSSAANSDQFYERSSSPQQWQPACSSTSACFSGLT